MWIFVIIKKLNVCYIIKKKFVKNFYDSFILIKFGDLKLLLLLVMQRYFIVMKINCWVIRIDY